jgi:hypothetical protein
MCCATGTGIAAAVFRSPLITLQVQNDQHNALYMAFSLIWPRIFFALNTTLTTAIVLKIW